MDEYEQAIAYFEDEQKMHFMVALEVMRNHPRSYLTLETAREVWEGKLMKIEIEIDESYISELVSQEIARRIVTEHYYESREAIIGIRDGVNKAIRQYIYTRKNEVIERVVDKAAVEIVKKGLPKLLDRLGEVKQ